MILGVPILLSCLAAGQMNGYQARISGNAGSESLRLIDRKGRVRFEVADYRVGFGPNCARHPNPQDLNGDGIPELQVETWSGGAHGGNHYFIISLGDQPKLRLAYDKNNVSGVGDFEVLPARHGSPSRIQTWYDGFYYRDDSKSGISLRSGEIPLVMEWRGGRYRDVTAHNPEVVRHSQDQAWKALRSGDERVRHSEAVRLLAIACLDGSQASTLRKLSGELRWSEWTGLERASSEVVEVMQERFRRYSYGPSDGAFHHFYSMK